jgi:hypothetical protein
MMGNAALWTETQTTFGPSMNIATTYGGWDVSANTEIFMLTITTNEGLIGVSSVGWLPDNIMRLYAHGGNLINAGEIYSAGPGSNLLGQTEDQYPNFSGLFTNNGVLIADTTPR